MYFKLHEHDLTLDINRTTKGLSCIAKHGSTSILCIVTVGDWEKFDSFIPLTVNYSERAYAINKIPAGFTKREGRQRENETLVARLIDRAIRPTIDPSFRYRISLSCFVLSYSKQCPIEPLAVTAASACLQAAGVPCVQVAGATIGLTNGKWSSGPGSDHTIHLSGNHYGISTIEAAGVPADPVSINRAINIFAIPAISGTLDFIKHKLHKFKSLSHSPIPVESKSVIVDGKAILEAYSRNDSSQINRLKHDFVSQWNSQDVGNWKWYSVVKSILRSNLLWTSKRIDGRELDEIRTFNVVKDLLPVHGSCLLSRGKTQVLSVVTVASNEIQVHESLDGNENRRFILHYNYLPTEKHSGTPSRRDIGHGNLARNALKNFLPQDKFIRIAAEVIDSDGSTSMATVCASYLALISAGLEISTTIAGISVGVIVDGLSHKFITDMSEVEDMLVSDMDMKLAGNHKGYTAIQMDLKIPFLPWSVFESAMNYGSLQLGKVLTSMKQFESNKNNSQPVPHNKQQVHAIQAHINQESQNSETEPADKGADKKEKSSSKFTLKLTNEQIDLVQKSGLLENLKKESQTTVNIKGQLLIVQGKNVNTSINKILTTAYESQKELHLGKLSTLSVDRAEVVLLTGRKCVIGTEDVTDELKEGLKVIIYKGRSGKWTFYSVLD